MADFQPHVPEHVERIFHNLFAPGRLFIGKQEKKVDVGTLCKPAAPIAADCHERHILRLGGIARRIGPGGCEFKQDVDQRIHQVAEPLGAKRAAAILHQHVFGIGAPARQRILQRLEHNLAHGKAGVAFIGRVRQFIELATERFGIDDLFQLQVVCAHAAFVSGFQENGLAMTELSYSPFWIW
ncbi:predicted protein [Brucella suis bv. 3 str. 686]|nr:predicted protein [Brucella suis bv. 3 str. 686]